MDSPKSHFSFGETQGRVCALGVRALLRLRSISLFFWLSLSCSLAGAEESKSKATEQKAKESEEKAETADSLPYAARAAPSLPSLSDDGGRGLRAVVSPIQGTIDLGLAPFIKRSINEAQGAAVLILNVDTFGGRVDAAVKIRDALLETQLPVVAFVNRRAISAGALISLAADYIVFTPGASMGAATPIQMQGGEAKSVGEKTVSYMRAEMAATAQAKDRDGLLAEAMVDADVAITGVTKKGKLLTVTTELALQLGLANAEANTLTELLSRMRLEHAEVIHPATNWAERLARFFTDPVVSGLLMSLGMLGLLIELYTPGVGFADALGLLCLSLFFGGHMVVELAGWGEVLLFGAGILALGAEIFIIPGFGIAGIAGIIMIVSSLVMAMIDLPISTAWNLGMISGSLGTVMISLTATTLLMIAAVQVLPRMPLAQGLFLSKTLEVRRARSQEPDSEPEPDPELRYLGKEGIAKTDLRMAGKILVEGELLDAVSRGDYIDAGTPIRVIEVEGFRVVVEINTEKGGEIA